MENDYPQPPTNEPEYYGQTHQPQFGQPPKKSRKKVFIVLGIVAGLLVLGGGGVAAFLLTRPEEKPAANTQTNIEKQKESQSPNVQKVGNKYTYKSTTLNIGVTYPQTWTMRETSDKQEIILTSPKAPYVKKDGTAAEGVFTIKLRNGIIPQGIRTTVGSSVAVADSEVIAYTQPAAEQRQYTNVSYMGPDANNFSFMLVTGNTEYKAGQMIGGGIDLNGQAYLFAGGYGTDAGDTLAFEQVPKAEFKTAVFEEAVKIFESLQLY